MNSKEKEDTVTLEILQTIEKKEDVTQRHLANRLDVALGLANSYLKRCVNKGLIKIQQAPANRYLYYLTPKGLSEKSRLTAQYLLTSFDFYRSAANSLTDVFKQCEKNGNKNIIFCGISELAEIASVRAHEFDVKILGVLDIHSEKELFLTFPVSKNINDFDEFDSCLITTLENVDDYCDSLSKCVAKEKILIPSILSVNHKIN